MTLAQSLEKQRKAGNIEFVGVPLNHGFKNKEFIVYDKSSKEFSRIFYNGKYREDKVDANEVKHNAERDFVKKYTSVTLCNCDLEA